LPQLSPTGFLAVLFNTSFNLAGETDAQSQLLRNAATTPAARAHAAEVPVFIDDASSFSQN
jgi:hypothetical protein